MKQVITVTQPEIEEAIREYVNKYVTPGYGKEMDLNTIHFEFDKDSNDELKCELAMTVKQKAKE